MKEYECVQVDHHKDVGKTIAEWQGKGWLFHTYACAHAGVFGHIVYHYVLFER